MSALASDFDLVEALIGRRATLCLRGHSTASILEKPPSALAHLGLSRQAALRLSAAAEIARRFQPSVDLGSPITDPRFVLSHVATLRGADVESLIVLLLDPRMRLIRVIPVATGALAHVAVTAREVLRHPLAHNAAAFVLCHNHPSGDVEPSRQDIGFTKTMTTAAQALDIDLVDHLIVARRAYFSFRAAGLLSPPGGTPRSAPPSIACADASQRATARRSDVRPNPEAHEAALVRLSRPGYPGEP
jgi:DNA repair protein RadC